ncbi:SDR family oxidoreductase [Paenibacillus abyssi]|uniref:3-ketoacyl-ACP reductase n=1 Tax=Paenibacillus abyssi TaxID=1340531 RepID=A0A917FVG6_9BACL|nr:SDR family NAD(P)-dependent oxidoreductase [Paenibacillus abyssi]GGG09089.1 3-ketoacyl-ACP reductase [Paenibacillus abyssi]
MEKSYRRLENKVAFITGAGSGIGKASAIQMAKEGAKVALAGLTLETLEEVNAQITESGGEALTLQTDISDEQSITDAYAAVLDRWGKLDIVFANAGINGTLSPIEEMRQEEWNKTIQTNLTGTFLTLKHAIPALKKQGGSIIITSSINGNRVFSNFGMSAYSTSKAGQVALMQMAALELAQFRIRVNAVCPGAIETNIDESTDRKKEVEDITIPVEFPEGDHPLRDAPGQAEQVASLITFLASDEASHITGTPIYIDGAESLLRG